jgi:hypothetical protein
MVMKKNKHIYKLMRYGVCIMKNVGRDTPPPGLRMEIAPYMYWHMANKMSINHDTLRGLDNLYKPVEPIHLLDGDGDPQENVITTVRVIMIKQKVAISDYGKGYFCPRQ